MRHRFSAYPLTDPYGRLTGMATLNRIRAVPVERRASTRLADIACPLDQLPTARPDEPVLSLLQRMTGCGRSGGRARRDRSRDRRGLADRRQPDGPDAGLEAIRPVPAGAWRGPDDVGGDRGRPAVRHGPASPGRRAGTGRTATTRAHAARSGRGRGHDDWRRVVHRNVLGLMYMTHAALPRAGAAGGSCRCRRSPGASLASGRGVRGHEVRGERVQRVAAFGAPRL